MISQFYDAMNNNEYIVDMSEVTSFTANGNSLQLYFADGTGYYHENGGYEKWEN